MRSSIGFGNSFQKSINDSVCECGNLRNGIEGCKICDFLDYGINPLAEFRHQQIKGIKISMHYRFETIRFLERETGLGSTLQQIANSTKRSARTALITVQNLCESGRVIRIAPLQEEKECDEQSAYYRLSNHVWVSDGTI